MMVGILILDAMILISCAKCQSLQLTFQTIGQSNAPGLLSGFSNYPMAK